ncbi:glycosyltransferase [Citricoccus sp. CH26A]|uniref:glycosyltransferase n=1 Tax=Citricoccus TaxID=169133 RepID=UPI002101A427|nr:glycosyltransferase [Citricoccus sp. CH26A]
MRVLRVVAVASRRGKYGGPFDTAMRQSALLNGVGYRARVLAGAFDGDGPEGLHNLDTFPVRHAARLRSFVDVAGMRMFPSLWQGVRTSDLVHISMAREPVPVMAAFTAVLTRTPMVLQPHGMLTGRLSLSHRILDVLVVRRLLGKAARIIALTDVERRQLEAWSSELAGRIDVIGNPPPSETGPDTLNTDHFADALFAARLHPRKRVLDFGLAAKTASSNGWNERYVVLGPDEGDLSALLRLAQNTNLLRYAGATDSAGVLERLKKSRTFVLTSESEPWGNVVVAALSLGKPVVITQSSALAALIESYGAGRVVPDGDPEAIAGAVHEVLKEENYAEYCRRAQRLAQAELSADGVRTALLRTYESASQSADPSARKGKCTDKEQQWSQK